MKSSQLPIGVVVPTLNVRTGLPAHLDQLQTWAELVEEIIVVDSYSTDGTVELLREKLRHPRLQILQCPPGLYAAWNYGISHLCAPFAYVSTVGDTITGEGLQHLAATAEALHSDVVISRPQFLDADGRPAAEQQWPIHNLLEWGAIKEPALVEPWRVFLLATLDIPEGILGSSASNLYRTDVLKRLPFPTDYGHAGDTAWGVLHAFHVSLAVTPKVVSRFVLHPSAARARSNEKKVLANRLFELARQAAREALEQSPPGQLKELLLPLLSELPAELQKLRALQDGYDQLRHQPWPWILNPSAWRARRERNCQRAQVRQTKEKIRQHFGSSSWAPQWVARET